MTTEPTNDNNAPAPVVKPRRWPRRVAVGVVLTGAALGTAYWYLGRETTLQTIVQKVANASGGKITVNGVTGSLYGAMHIKNAVYRTPESVVTVDNIDIDWSPWQYMSRGIAINKIYVARVHMQTLKEGEPAKMPASLAPPFTMAIEDARIGKLIMTNAQKPNTAPTEIEDIAFRLHSDKKTWTLSRASASTPWGVARADGTIETRRPFKLDAKGSFSQSVVGQAEVPARMDLHATGDLTNTLVAAVGKAGRAEGALNLALAPFETIPLRSAVIKAKNLNPDILAPGLPTADLSIDVNAGIRPDRTVSGHVEIVNDGPFGTIDQERLPLRALKSRLSGNLDALQVTDMLADLGQAGRFTGSGSVERPPLAQAAATGLPTVKFDLHTDRIDLRQLHGKMKATAIAGDIRIANEGKVQTLNAQLADKGMRLDAQASLADNVIEVQRAVLAAGKTNVQVKGTMGLQDEKAFKVAASANRFNPADFGDYPAADVNLDLNASGALAPEWKVAADFAFRPSRLFGQALSGRGKVAANPKHISGVNATLALGRNSARLNGALGAAGDKLAWDLDARDLTMARPDLVGAIKGSGVITGTMEAPRTTFAVDATGLGMGAGNAKRVNNPGVIRASGTAALGPAVKDGPRTVQVLANGSMRQLNPAAFGAPVTGNINGDFGVNGRMGAALGGTVNLTLAPSTLNNAPLGGHLRATASGQRVSNADIDLRVGPNVIAAKGGFGARNDRLDWRIDAPQLGVIGPDFGGVVRGAGTLTGTLQAPAVNGTLDGAGLRLPGGHQVGTVRVSANVGSGRGGADPLGLDATVTNYAMNGEQVLANARLTSTGTRASHAINLSARGPQVDVLGAVRGGWDGRAWNGTIAQLQNKGLYAFTLQSPATLRIAGAPGSGLAGLTKPQQLNLSSAVIALPAGQVNIASLNKTGPRWTSTGTATGVPLQYLAQFSPAVAENLRGDLALGGDWSLDMRAPPRPGAAPQLAGSVHVFRERGDVIAGAASPVVLGLRTLDLRADVARGALRVQANIDGARAGTVRLDATAAMINGRLGTASPLRMTASADVGSIAWLAPLANQPGLALDGALRAGLTGGGTVGQPTLNGSILGDGLSVRWPDQGVRLRNGQLRAQLTGDQLVLQRLSFEGNQGNAVADGAVRFAGGEATMRLNLAANGLEALSRPDRTVVITGRSTLVRDATRFAVEGDVKVDRALIELAPQGRPTLSSDVIVLGRNTPAAKAREKEATPLTVDLKADLGDNFRLRGMGADARLNGELQLRMAGGRPPRLNGAIRVANGTYKAYGQNLTIERGVLTFSGPYDNPSLNILAVRKRPEGEQLSETNVEAGVQVRGTALAPQAKLVSTPNVPDSEKLSWLVLGRGTEGVSGNDAGVLSAAAGALLGGKGGGGIQSKVADSLGLDELGLSQAQGLESTVVTIGKRISSRAYLTFEQGASSASSLVKLRYKFTPRITLQFQTGTNTALDVLYSWAWD